MSTRFSDTLAANLAVIGDVSHSIKVDYDPINGQDNPQVQWEWVTEPCFSTEDLLRCFTRLRTENGEPVFTHTVTTTEVTISEYVGFGHGHIDVQEVRFAHALIVHDDSAIITGDE